jgi:hypothetical protein
LAKLRKEEEEEEAKAKEAAGESGGATSDEAKSADGNPKLVNSDKNGQTGATDVQEEKNAGKWLPWLKKK